LLPVRADVTHDAALEQAVRIIIERLGNITLLVNAAGFAPPRETVMKTALADWDRILATCLRAPMVLARLVLPDMLAHARGTIVNVAPSTGAQGRAGESAYAAAKFGLLGFTQSLAAEVREHGITVTAIVPGSVQEAASAAYESDAASVIEPAHVADAVLDILANPSRLHPTEIPLPSPA
jgi:NAD(P)-dependent dehydrogenase (short-subunit alcohol dehydrogenase family)